MTMLTLLPVVGEQAMSRRRISPCRSGSNPEVAPPTCRRRPFVLGLLAGTVLPRGDAVAGTAEGTGGRLASLFSDLASARTLGRAVAAAQPCFAPPGAALRACRPDVAACVEAPSAGARPRELVRDAVRADFAAGRTVLVRGWLLARTEALLCVVALEDGMAPAPQTATARGNVPC